MSRPTCKTDLLTAAAAKYEEMNKLIDKLPAEVLATPFDFSADVKKKEAHWQRDKNLRDVLIHLYEWHQLLLNWIAANQNGQSQPFIPLPYNWMLAQSHQQVLALAEQFSNEELFTKGVYKWVGGSPLGSYFVSTTSSHYDWAIKKLKAHNKNCQA